MMCGMNDKEAFTVLRGCYIDEIITKEEYAYTLREHQVACNEMKRVRRGKEKKVLGIHGKGGKLVEQRNKENYDTD